MDLNNKIVLITGIGPGLGRTCAEAFAQHGAKTDDFRCADDLRCEGRT